MYEAMYIKQKSLKPAAPNSLEYCRWAQLQCRSECVLLDFLGRQSYQSNGGDTGSKSGGYQWIIRAC